MLALIDDLTWIRLMVELSHVVTDFLVVGFNVLFSLLILQVSPFRMNKTLTVWFTLFFIASAINPLSKALDIMYPPESSFGNLMIEKCCFIFYGLSGLAAFNIASKLCFAKKLRKRLTLVSYFMFVVMSLCMMTLDYNFLILLVHNSVGFLFLQFALLVLFYKKWEKSIAYGVLGVLLCFLSLMVRQLSMGINNEVIGLNLFFDSLALASTYLLYRCAKYFVRKENLKQLPHTAFVKPTYSCPLARTAL
ncbi:MAG: DUF6962 family protein [Rickettsiales bacterium]